MAKPGPKAKCCGKEAYDEDKQLCCGTNKTILTRQSIHHRCCGHDQFDMKTQCCCTVNYTLQIKPVSSKCCQQDSEPNNEAKPKARCGGEKEYNMDKQLCCGPVNNKTILTKQSIHHLCCGHDQYDKKTQCCCTVNGMLKVEPICSSCCLNESGVQQQKPTPHLNCTEPNTSRCGLSCYNPNESACCERKQTEPYWHCNGQGQCNVTATVYNPHTHVCCDGCVSPWKPWIDHCCGETPYGLAQRGVVCCDNNLYEHIEDGEECSEISVPYNPAKGTVCGSHFHASPGQHCCGTEIYRPHCEICCNGHRHPKGQNMRCCGVKAYDIKDPQMKCCSGTLYNLTSLGKHGGDVQCCGSVLQHTQNQDVCCSSEDEELLYSAKARFKCCGHLYYNTSLWSCCAGKLSPVSGQHNESRFLSVNNLNKRQLCKKMLIRTVESVSLHSIVFSSVLEVDGRGGTVRALPSPSFMEIPDHCSYPKVIPGKTYFFDEVNVFIDFNHDSILQSLHFILSKCYCP